MSEKEDAITDSVTGIEYTQRAEGDAKEEVNDVSTLDATLVTRVFLKIPQSTVKYEEMTPRSSAKETDDDSAQGNQKSEEQIVRRRRKLPQHGQIFGYSLTRSVGTGQR